MPETPADLHEKTFLWCRSTLDHISESSGRNTLTVVTSALRDTCWAFVETHRDNVLIPNMIARAATSSRNRAEELLREAMRRHQRRHAHCRVARPPIHPPRPLSDDTTGWGAIDNVDVMDCAVNKFVLFEDVDGRDIEWAIAVSEVLGLWDTGGALAVERALKWFLVLPQLLFRVPPRGGRRGRAEVASRFRAWGDRRLSTLLAWWKTDLAAWKDPSLNHGPQEDRNIVKKALALFRDRQIGKGVSLLVSGGMVDPTDPGVIDALEALHPKRTSNIPSFRAHPGASKIKLPALSHTLRALKSRRGVGPSGMRNEYLRALTSAFADPSAQRCFPRLKRFCESLVNNELPGWYYRVTASIRLIALIKRPATTAGELPALRPIGVGETLRRAVNHAVMADAAPAFARRLFPLQVAVGVPGAASLLVNWAHVLLGLHPSWVLIKIDMANAFNTIDCAAMLLAIFEDPELQHWYPAFFAWISKDANIHLGAAMILARFLSEDGGQQGDVLVMGGFCLALQKHVVELDRALGDAGECRFYADDGYLAVDPTDPRVPPALAAFRANVLASLRLLIAEDKLECFSHSLDREGWDPSLLAITEGTVTSDDGVVIGRGVKVMGVPVGCATFVEKTLATKASKCVSKINTLVSKLRVHDLSALWCANYYCTQTLMHHWLQLCAPPVVASAAATVDAALLAAAKVAIPADPTADAISLRRFRQPSRLHGSGFRSCVDVSHAAYVGAVDQALPRFLALASDDGSAGVAFSPLCEPALGVGSFNPGGERYLHLIESAPARICIGQYLVDAWSHMQGEAGIDPEAPDFDPLSSLLAGPVHLLGKGTPKLQMELTRQIEGHRHEVLAVDMHALPCQDRRRVAYRNVNRYSMQWCHSWPDYDSACTNLEWELGTARCFGLKVPSLLPYVGQRIGKTQYYVDEYGDNLARASTPGDDWRWQHDGFLVTLFDDLADNGVNVTDDLVGLFRGVIPDPAQRLRFDQLSFRTRRGMVPDGRISMPVGDDPVREVFVEFKTLHWGTSTYSGADIRHAARSKSVQRRADKVHAEYVKKAIDLDSAYCGTTAGSRPGPSEQRLIGLGPVRPLVLGHYGELSTFFEELLSTAADAGAQKHWRGMRCASAEDARGLIVSMLRRSWGMAAFRLNARLVIRRLQHVSGAKVPGHILPLSRVRRRFRRRRDYASEHFGRNRHSEGVH